jgi:DNA-binding MarR family transcriptional regulator
VLTQLYDSRLRDTGMEAPQFALMMTLDRQGPCSQSALGRRYALDKTTVSRNLKLLERNGWVEPSAGIDRRERQFTLTAAGRKRLAAARPEWKKAQDQLRSGMTAEQWDAMFHVFRTVTEAARRQTRGPASSQ